MQQNFDSTAHKEHHIPDFYLNSASQNNLANDDLIVAHPAIINCNKTQFPGKIKDQRSNHSRGHDRVEKADDNERDEAVADDAKHLRVANLNGSFGCYNEVKRKSNCFSAIYYCEKKIKKTTRVRINCDRATQCQLARVSRNSCISQQETREIHGFELIHDWFRFCKLLKSIFLCLLEKNE